MWLLLRHVARLLARCIVFGRDSASGGHGRMCQTDMVMPRTTARFFMSACRRADLDVGHLVGTVSLGVAMSTVRRLSASLNINISMPHQSYPSFDNHNLSVSEGTNMRHTAQHSLSVTTAPLLSDINSAEHCWFLSRQDRDPSQSGEIPHCAAPRSRRCRELQPPSHQAPHFGGGNGGVIEPPLPPGGVDARHQSRQVALSWSRLSLFGLMRDGETSSLRVAC